MLLPLASSLPTPSPAGTEPSYATLAEHKGFFQLGDFDSRTWRHGQAWVQWIVPVLMEASQGQPPEFHPTIPDLPGSSPISAYRWTLTQWAQTSRRDRGRSARGLAQELRVRLGLPVPSTLLRRLATSDRPGARAAVARHPQSRSRLLQQLLHDHDDLVRIALATRCPVVPCSFQAILAQDRHRSVRLAITTYADRQILPTLAKDTDPFVRTKVASRPDCPSHVLEALASDLALSVRTAVRDHPGTPAPIRTRLSLTL